MKSKIKYIQILRHLTQIASIFLLPGLYILAFNELKTIYTMSIKGNFNFINVFPNLIELTTVILATIFIGRFFCGWFCTFGAYNDLIHLISKKIFGVNFKVNPKLDAVLRYTKYLVLFSIVTISWNTGSTILRSSSPWDAFAQITDISSVLSNVAIGFMLLLVITIGAFYIERFFCKYLCPLGAVFTLISKVGFFKISKPKDKCGKCRLCTNNCSMGLPLYKVNSVCGGECINCFQCIEACPRKNTKANILGENINSSLASSVAVAAFVGVYALSNASSTILTDTGLASRSNISVATSKSVTSGNYKDGTYTGSGTGYRNGATEVSVTIQNGQISSIDTVSTQDTQRFYSGAEGTLFNEIISAQSANVDTVSGATYSSQGIISGVKDALTKAEIATTTNSADSSNSAVATDTPSSDTGTSDTTTANSTTTAPAVAPTPVAPVAQGQYKDGTYTGSGRGFRGGTTTLTLTIKSGKIANIQTVSSQDSSRFYNGAEGVMFNEVISAQSSSVDTVSGATYSSNGILSAVGAALAQAK